MFTCSIQKIGLFLKSFVSCVRGVDNVGLVMICYGVADVLGSYGFGYAIKYVGRIPIFLFAALSNYAIILAMIFWEPSEATSYSLFLMAVAWGLSDAVWQTQINCKWFSARCATLVNQS